MLETLCFLAFTLATGDAAAFNAANIVGIFPTATQTEIVVVQSQWTMYTVEESYDEVLGKITSCKAVQVVE